MIVKGYHGTTLSVARLLTGGEPFLKSTGGGHWLGSGVYFFQDGFERAKYWAKTRCAAGEAPAVLSADIDLSDCLDLLDLWGWKRVENHHKRLSSLGFSADQEGLEVRNGRAKPPKPGTSLASNFGDRLMLDWTVAAIERRSHTQVRSVRSSFLWGRAVYPESFLFSWSQVQIAVRDRAAISNLSIC